MGSKVKSGAMDNSAAAQGQFQSLNNNASNIYGSLAPQLQAEATHPAGYNASDLAAMNTAGQQSAGGGQAGAVGQGALLASRTKNAGTADAAIAQSARNAGQNLSSDALKTQMGNANLKQQQQQEGLQGEQGLYNTDLGASQNALGISNQSLSLANQVKPGFWQQTGEDLGKDALKAAAVAAVA